MTKQKQDKLEKEFGETVTNFRNYLNALAKDFKSEIAKGAQCQAQDCLRVLKDSFEYIKFETSAGPAPHKEGEL